MTKSNSSNQNNNINKAVNLFPRWEIEERNWNTEVGTKSMNVYNMDTNRIKTVQVQGYPRIKSPDQLYWEKFYASIVELTSGIFYPERDLQGNVVEPSDGKARARIIISQIIRLKSVLGKEYLYLGTVYGFNSLGVLVSYPYHRKEAYTKTVFKKNRFYDSKSGHMTEKNEGPMGQQEEYLLEFFPEAVDELFEDVVKHDTPLVYRRNRHKTPDNPCNFIVKDESTGTAIAVEWSSLEKTLELFRTKSFEYLFNAEYIPAPVKAEMRQRTEGLTDEKIQQSPKIQDNSNTTSSVNNTSAYK
ncbi:MAG TPA: hypothetical protein VJ697_14715 [Nitrososphaeraceae archaeon]|nr:hypothetical protein [Nitrososphaeraceae archaeon]